MNANQRLEDKEKALLNAEGEVAALNRRISNLEEELEKTEDRFVTNIFTYRKVANSSVFWLVHVSVGKGQLFSKTDWRAIESPKKRIDYFFYSPWQTNQIRPFIFWENLWRSNLLFSFILPLA